MNLQLLKENFERFLKEEQLDEKLVLKKYSPKNLIVVISDKAEFKDRGNETYKASQTLKKAGFKWTSFKNAEGKEVMAWAIEASKEKEARALINSLNKETTSSTGQEKFEEFALDLAAVSKKSGMDDKIIAFLERLGKEADQAKASQQFQDYVNFAKKFKTYSFTNTMLIYIQKPDATRVAGFNKWKEFNRHIKAGAKGIGIFAPKTKAYTGHADTVSGDTSPVANPNERELDKQIAKRSVITGFMIVHVYDISDTEVMPGKEDLATVKQPQWHAGNDPDEKADKISKAVEDIIEMIELKYTQTGGKGEQGYAAGGKHINISSGVAGVNKASVLVHELAHILMHFPNSIFNDEELGHTSTGVKEYQAESVAASVMDEYGLPYKHSQTYIAFWNQGIGDVTKYTNMILKAAKYIINEIDKRVEKETKDVKTN